MKAQTFDLETYGMIELSFEDQLCINGEYSWNQFCNDAGYLAGSAVAYATNAADIIGQAIFSDLVGKAVTGAPRK